MDPQAQSLDFFKARDIAKTVSISIVFSSVGDSWHFCADPDPDPRIRTSDSQIRNSAPDPDPTPDPTPFVIDLKDTKILFSYFFFITCPQAHRLQAEKFNFLLEFCVQILFCRHYFSQLNTIMRKVKEPDPDPNPWLMDPDPGVPKTCGSGSASGSGSPTLVFSRVATRFSWLLPLPYMVSLSVYCSKEKKAVPDRAVFCKVGCQA
jgi:hypothetical protein